MIIKIYNQFLSTKLPNILNRKFRLLHIVRRSQHEQTRSLSNNNQIQIDGLILDTT